MNDKNRLSDWKDESCGSNFSETDKSSSLIEADDSLIEADDSPIEAGDSPIDCGAAVEPKGNMNEPEPDFSLKSPKNFSYPKWLKSTLPQYFNPALWMAVLFFVFVAVGYVAGYHSPEIFNSLPQFDNLSDSGSFEIMLYIFLHNSGILFALIFLGFFFSVLPVLIVIANGFALGIAAEAFIRYEGFAFLLTGLLPHGIIELPLILFGAGIGFQLGVRFVRFLLSQIGDNQSARRIAADRFKKDFLNAAGIYFFFLLPLLLVAAIVEVYVTGTLLDMFF